MSSNERRGVQTIDLPPTFQRHLKGEDRRINEPTKLPKPTERSDLKPLTTSRLSARVNELSSQYDKTEGTDLDSQTMDNTVLSSEEALPNARPTTTQVYDYRNRNRLRSGPKIAGQSSKVDIREGRWIKSINRDEE